MIEKFQLIDAKTNSLRLKPSFNLRDETLMTDSFGKNLQKWREDARINQSELARRVGVSPNYISNLERDYSPSAKGGKPQPSVDVVDKIARAVGVPTAKARLAAGYAPMKTTSDDSKVESDEEFEALFMDSASWSAENRDEALDMAKMIFKRYQAKEKAKRLAQEKGIAEKM